MRFAALAAGAAAHRQEHRVAGVDDEVRLGAAHAIDDQLLQIGAVQARVLERQVAASVLHVAVAGVDEVDERRHAAPAGERDVGRHLLDRRRSSSRRRGSEPLRGRLRVQPARAVVEPAEQVGPRAERAKQLQVGGRVVVGVAQRAGVAVDALVDADDDGEARGGGGGGAADGAAGASAAVAGAPARTTSTIATASDTARAPGRFIGRAPG